MIIYKFINDNVWFNNFYMAIPDTANNDLIKELFILNANSFLLIFNDNGPELSCVAFLQIFLATLCNLRASVP